MSVVDIRATCNLVWGETQPPKTQRATQPVYEEQSKESTLQSYIILDKPLDTWAQTNFSLTPPKNTQMNTKGAPGALH